jgi:hypothetical protein
VVGLTSPGNVALVDGLGIYSRVVGYDSVAELAAGPATFVDFAGNPEVRAAVHEHYGEQLLHSTAVGVTHWEGLEGLGAELPGPQPVFFFAPTRVQKRAKDWGRAGLETAVAEAWHPFCEWTEGWLEVIHGQGFEALRDAYLEVLEGRVGPRSAHVISLR